MSQEVTLEDVRVIGYEPIEYQLEPGVWRSGCDLRLRSGLTEFTLRVTDTHAVDVIRQAWVGFLMDPGRNVKLTLRAVL